MPPKHADLISCALNDLDRGYYSVRLAAGRKRPRDRGWNTLRLESSELTTAFEQGDNRGRLLGLAMTAQSGLTGYGVCVDLDCPESIALAAALLPTTSERGGRSGAPQSHWFFRTERPPRTLRLSGPDKTRYVELLALGSQVVVPPSVHPSGEPYLWDADGLAAEVMVASLRSAVIDLAIATLCHRSAPPTEVSDILKGSGLPGPRRERLLAVLSGRPWDPVSQVESSAIATHIRGWLAGH